MRSISSTMKRLAAQQALTRSTPNQARSRLPELRDFGSNPGSLRALYYVPDASMTAPALVVAFMVVLRTPLASITVPAGRNWRSDMVSPRFSPSSRAVIISTCVSTGTMLRTIAAMAASRARSSR